jgi:hypothetical protein
MKVKMFCAVINKIQINIAGLFRTHRIKGGALKMVMIYCIMMRALCKDIL